MALHLPRVNIVISDAKGFDSQGELSTLSIGFGLHQAWIYAALFGTSTIFGVPQLVPLGARAFSFASVTEFFVASIVTFIVALLVMGATDQRFLRLYTSKRAMCASAALMCVSTFALLTPAASSGAAPALSVAAGVASGAGSALLLLFWGTAFARCSSSSIVMNTMIAVVFAMIVYAVLLYVVPAPLSGVITALLPLAELPVLWKKTPESYILRHEVPIFQPLPVRKGRFSVRFGVPVLLAGFALGSLRSISTQIILPSPDLSVNALVMVAASIVVVVILTLTLFAGMHRYWDSLFRLLLPVVMLTLCFLPLSITDNSIAASVILVTGYLCLEALMWIFLGQLCQTFRLSAVFVFGVGRSMLALGSLAGTLTLTNTTMLDALTPFGSYSGILFYIAALVLAYMFLPRVRDIKRMIDPDFEHRHTPLDDINDEAAELDAVVRDQPREENDPLSPQGASPLETISDSGRMTISHDEADAELNTRMISADDLMDEGTLAAIDAARANGEKDSTPVAEPPSKKRSGRFRTQCETIANRYLLSRRETEVLFLLAKGYNAAYIQKKLCITQSTAKTHIYHIYQKLDIHTQQELLAMVSEESER